MCASLGAEVPGLCQKQLTQTLIVRLLRTTLSTLILDCKKSTEKNRVSDQTWSVAAPIPTPSEPIGGTTTTPTPAEIPSSSHLSTPPLNCRNVEGRCKISGKHICQSDLQGSHESHKSPPYRQSRWKRANSNTKYDNLQEPLEKY